LLVLTIQNPFGSFTIIVLGISILGVVNGIAAHNWTTPSIISAGLGLGIAFSLWWIYFDTVDGSEIRALRESKQIGVYVAWLYIHFPLIIGFTAFGVSARNLLIQLLRNLASWTIIILCGNAKIFQSEQRASWCTMFNERHMHTISLLGCSIH
jgi:low temperature requirement protein LtrA